MKVSQLRQKLKLQTNEEMTVISGCGDWYGYDCISQININKNGYLELLTGPDTMTVKELLEKIEKINDDFEVTVGAIGGSYFYGTDGIGIETLDDNVLKEKVDCFVIYWD